jgi:hypothetical protein
MPRSTAGEAARRSLYRQLADASIDFIELVMTTSSLASGEESEKLWLILHFSL